MLRRAKTGAYKQNTRMLQLQPLEFSSTASQGFLKCCTAESVGGTVPISGTKVLNVSIKPEKERTLWLQTFHGHFTGNGLEQTNLMHCHLYWISMAEAYESSLKKLSDVQVNN